MDQMCDRHYYGHLRWTSRGEVLATWRLQPLTPGHTRPLARVVQALHTQLFRSLAGHEILLLGQLVWTDVASIVDRMTADVDLANSPAWAKECAATYDRFGDQTMGERRWSLHARLNLPGKAKAKMWARTAFNRMAHEAGVVPLPPTAEEIHAATQAADRLEKQLPAEFAPVRASEAELVWQRRHAQTRGAGLVDPFTAPALAEELLEISGRAAVGDPVLDEGGLTDLDTGVKAAAERARATLSRRWLKVIDDTGEESWQAGMVLSKVPHQVDWPTIEFLGRIDESAVPLDVAIRGPVRPQHESLRRNRAAIRQLNDQLDQLGDADAAEAARMLKLHRAANVLAEFTAEMESDDKEVEVAPVIMVSTASQFGGDDVDQAAKEFLNAKMNRDITWARPPGAQESIFWSMQPGSVVPARLRDYQQITSGRALAATAPVVNHALGSATGVPLGLNVQTPLRKAVFLDLFGNITNDHMSATFALSGEQGAGKSVTQKLITGAIVDRGGRMIATDSTRETEWVTFAESLGVDVAVVNTADPTTSLDPLRTLPPVMAGAAVKAFLITLLDVAATSGEGVAIAKSLSPSYLERFNIDSMGAWQRHMGSSECTLPHAALVADKVAVFADPDMSGSLASVVFDSTLPAIDLDARAIVIATHNVAQPTNAELGKEHLFKGLSPEKIFGRALMALIVRMAREVCFSDRSDEAVFQVDEAHMVTRSNEAVEALTEFVRVGRHYKAALITGSHNFEADYPDETLRGLIKNRLVMRQPDLALAKAAARGLNFDEAKDPERFDAAVSMIQNMPKERGVGLFQDYLGRQGMIQILLPGDPDRRQACLSTPPQKQQTGRA